MPLPIRVYADSSVFGGVFDEEFAQASRSFFDSVRDGRFQLVLSVLVEDEVADAPSEVSQLLEEMLALADAVEVTDEVEQLARAYTEAGVITQRWLDDATHVALATAAGCALIVSWNFKHIVHYQKIPRYNAVNVLRGYPTVAIYSPLEIMGDEEE